MTEQELLIQRVKAARMRSRKRGTLGVMTVMGLLCSLKL